MALIHLIYTSAAREEFDDAALDEILRQSVRNNAACGVTGMLLYAAGSFMQALEGEEAVVDAVYARIAPDPRHHDIMLLERAPITERSFAGFSMGFRRIGARDAQVHPAWAPLFEFGFQTSRLPARPGLALEMLSTFARNARP